MNGFRQELQGINASTLAAVLDSAPYGIVFVDGNRNVLAASTEFYRITGTTPERIVGTPLAEFFSEGHFRWSDLEENPGRAYSGIVRIPGGNSKYLEAILVDIDSESRDGPVAGEGLLFTVYVRDMGFWMRVERALTESETRARSYFDQGLIGMARMSPDAAYLEVNDALCRFFGRNRDELLNTTQLDIVAGDADDYRRFFQSLVGGTITTAVHETSITIPDGSTRPFRVHYGLETNDAHETMAVVALYVDIGAEKAAAEEAEESRRQLLRADRLATLGTLVSGTAHEINNPNQVIMANAEMAESAWRRYARDKAFRSPDSEKMERFLSRISEGARRIDGIVEDLKEYVRDSRSPAPEAMDLNAAALYAASLLDQTIDDATSRFSLDLEPNLPSVFANPVRIGQVIVNLIQNACQALETRDGAISIQTTRMDDDARLEVIDEGKGIPELALGKVTDPFFTTRRDEGGTGLGLAVSESIVRDYGGRLEFDRRNGGGTIARIVLPTAAKQD